MLQYPTGVQVWTVRAQLSTLKLPLSINQSSYKVSVNMLGNYHINIHYATLKMTQKRTEYCNVAHTRTRYIHN